MVRLNNTLFLALAIALSGIVIYQQLEIQEMKTRIAAQEVQLSTQSTISTSSIIPTPNTILHSAAGPSDSQRLNNLQRQVDDLRQRQFQREREEALKPKPRDPNSWLGAP